MVFSRVLLISDDMTWQVYVTEFQVSMDNEILRPYSATLSVNVIPDLIQRLDSATMCIANFEPIFVEIAQVRKGKLLSSTGNTVAVLDEKVCINVGGVYYFSTVRHVNCSILINSAVSVCSTCSQYRNTLRAMASRHKKLTSPSINTNVRYLRTPQRSAYIKSLQRAIQTKNQQILRLKTRIKNLINSSACVELDDQLNADIMKIVEDHQQLTEKDDFKRIFWEQQVYTYIYYISHIYMHVCMHVCIMYIIYIYVYANCLYN